MPKKRHLAVPFVVTLAVVPACAASGASGGGPAGPGGGGSRIDRHEDGTCWQVHEVSCPPEALCNPPPPQQVDCATGGPIVETPTPEPDAGGFAEPPPETPEQPDAGGGDPGYRIDRRADNSCWKMWEVSCPPQAKCNPPPPQRVDCDTHEPLPEPGPRP